MTDRPASPFSGLDKALLRSTQPHSAEESNPSPAHSSSVKVAKPRQSARTSREATGTTKKPMAPTEPPVRETPSDAIASLQQALKAVGKEIYYVRVTPSEKQRVDDLVHKFKREGLRTSVNEIGRIALNSLLADYNEMDEQSILSRVVAVKRAGLHASRKHNTY